MHAVTTAAVEIATASSSAAAVARTRSNLTARPRSLELKRSILARNAAFCDLRGLLRAAALRFAWFIYSARRCSRSFAALDVRGVHITCSRADFFFSTRVFAARTTRLFCSHVIDLGPAGGLRPSHGFTPAQFGGGGRRVSNLAFPRVNTGAIPAFEGWGGPSRILGAMGSTGIEIRAQMRLKNGKNPRNSIKRELFWPRVQPKCARGQPQAISDRPRGQPRR